MAKRVPMRVTNHAIDRASLRMMARYLERKRVGIGFYSWLKREAQRAYQGGEGEQEKRIYDGYFWVFHGITLVTVFGVKEKPDNKIPKTLEDAIRDMNLVKMGDF